MSSTINLDAERASFEALTPRLDHSKDWKGDYSHVDTFGQFAGWLLARRAAIQPTAGQPVHQGLIHAANGYWSDITETQADMWKADGFTVRTLYASPVADELRAALAAAPASVPPPELTWLYTHCKAIGMTCKSDSGKWEHDIAQFTMDLQDEIKATKSAAPEVAQPAAQGESIDTPEFRRLVCDILFGEHAADQMAATDTLVAHVNAWGKSLATPAPTAGDPPPVATHGESTDTP